jgi:hypothetical protein
MTYKKLVNFYVFILSILLVNLVSGKLTDLILSFKLTHDPYKATGIGMVILVFVLYPAYNWLDDLSEQSAKRIFKVGKNAGGKFFGVTLMFLLSLGILFLIYLNIWFGWKPVETLFLHNN